MITDIDTLEGVPTPATAAPDTAADAAAGLPAAPTEPDTTPGPGVTDGKGVLLNRIERRCRDFTAVQRAISSDLHADQVVDVAALLSIGGDDGSSNKDLAALFKTYQEETAPEAMTHRAIEHRRKGERSGSVYFLGKPKVNPGYRQAFQAWTDLGRWQAGLFRKPDEKSGRRGEVPVGAEFAIKCVRVREADFERPADALRAGCTLTDTYYSFRNVIRPSILDITGDPDLGHAYYAGVAASAEVEVVVKRRQKVGGVWRWQRARIEIGTSPVAMFGYIVGLLGRADMLLRDAPAPTLVNRLRGDGALAEGETIREKLVQLVQNPAPVVATEPEDSGDDVA